MLSKKLFLSVVCFIFGICAFAGGSTFHNSFSYRGECIVTEEVINVRSGPGTNYEKLFQVKAGDIVEVISKCDEKMYADDAYANWYKIEKDGQTGFMCSRWLSGDFLKVSFDDNSYCYIAYEAFYIIPENFDPDWDSYTYIEDDFIFIKDGKIKKDKSLSFIPDSNATLYMPPLIEETDGVSLGKGCIINLRRYAKYGAGACVYSDICSVSPDLSIKKIVTANTFWEGGSYNYVEFQFENVTFDVYTNMWYSGGHNEKGKIVVTTKSKTSGPEEVKTETIRWP